MTVGGRTIVAALASVPGAAVLLLLTDAATTGARDPAEVLIASSLAAAAALAAWPVFAASRGIAAFYRHEGQHSVPTILLFASALLAWPAWLIVAEVTSGATFSRHTAAVPARLVLAVGLAAAASTGFFGIARLGAASRSRRIVAVGVALAVVVGSTLVNSGVLVRQYPIAHLVCASQGAIAAVVAVRAISTRWMPVLGGAALATLLVNGLVPGPSVTTTPARRIAEAAEALLWPEDRLVTGDAGALDGYWGRTESGRADRWLNGRDRPTAVILVTIDALRARSVGHLGYDRRPTTPFLDSLAAESTVFTGARSQASVSLPSIMSMFTGRYPASLAVTRERFGTGEAAPEMTLAEILSDSGFATVGLPAFHPDELAFEFAPFSRGFSDWRPSSDGRRPSAKAICDGALGALRAHRGRPHFLWMHFIEVHGPYDGPRPWGDGDLETYDAAIRHVDDAFGVFFRSARDEGLLDDAIVVVHGDHGEEFEEHGGRYHGSTLYEEQIHVPLMLWARGAGPARVDAPVELVDVVPTTLECLGITPPLPIHGDSLFALAVGDDMPSVAIAQLLARTRIVPDRIAVIDGRWKAVADGAGQGPMTLHDLVADPLETAPVEAPAEVRKHMAAMVNAARTVVATLPPATRAHEPSEPSGVLISNLEDPDAVRSALGSADTVEVEAAVREAMAIGPDEFVTELTAILTSPAPDRLSLRRGLIRSIGAGTRVLEPAVRQSLDADPPTAPVDELLEALAKTGGSDTVPWLTAWAGRHPGRAAPARLMLTAAALGDRAMRALALQGIGELDGPLVWATLAALAPRSDVELRSLLLGIALAEPANAAANGFALGLLSQASDSVVPELFATLRGRDHALAMDFDNLALALLEAAPDTPGVRTALDAIYRNGGTTARMRALERLARFGPPREVLDALEQSRRAPIARIPPPRPGTLPGTRALPSLAEGPPLLILRFALESPVARRRFVDATFMVTAADGSTTHGRGLLLAEGDRAITSCRIAAAAGAAVEVAYEGGRATFTIP